MINQIFFAALMLMVQSISALNILNVPTGTVWNPCSTYGLTLDGNGIGPGSNVRIEMWDNVDGVDVEKAVLAKSIIVDENNTVSVTVPCDYPKSRNAFLRVYYRDHNAVSGRIYIRKNEISSKTCVKPTITPTIMPTHHHSCSGHHHHDHHHDHHHKPQPTPTPGAIIHPGPGAVIYDGQQQPQPTPGAIIHPGPGAVIYDGPHNSTTVTPTQTATIVPAISSIIRSKSTNVTSTSSATTAKYSFGSIALALAIALSTLLF